MILKQYNHQKYNRQGLVCFKDPVRNILVQVTPEEQVRQDVVQALLGIYGYTVYQLKTEYMIPNTRIRADIVVNVQTNEIDENGYNIEKPYIVIECKSRDVYISQEHFEQGVEYCEKLDATYLILTNGNDTGVYKRDKEYDYQLVEDIPKFKDLSSNNWFPKNLEDDEEVLQRPTYYMLNDESWLKKAYEDTYGEWIISADTHQQLWAVIIDLQHFLMELEFFFTSPIKWKGYEFVEDLGVSIHSFGNRTGGSFDGWFRSFLAIDRKGNTQIIRFGLFALEKNNDPVYGNNNGTTYFNVAVCNEENMHNSLQLNLNMSVKKTGILYHFFHRGQMNAGNKGRVKNKEVVDYVHQYEPSLSKGDSIYLGTINHTRLIEWEDVKELLLNMAVYALLRDDLRNDISSKE